MEPKVPMSFPGEDRQCCSSNWYQHLSRSSP